MGMGWAHCFLQDMWWVTLNGPSVGTGSYCSVYGVGPFLLRKMSSIVVNGP